MWKYSLFIIVCLLTALASCKKDDSIKNPNIPDNPSSDSTGVLAVNIFGNAGISSSSNLTEYVESLTILFFKENANDVFVLESYQTFTEAELNGFATVTSTTSGITNAKIVEFDSIPIGTYQVACIGNIFDQNGEELTNAELSGLALGATLQEVIVQILSDSPSPRLFFDLSDTLLIGSDEDLNLVLERKVSMLNLTLLEVPAAVTMIEVEIGETYDAFYANGTFLAQSSIIVAQSETYSFSQTQDTVSIQVYCLPTVSDSTSTLNVNFTINNGDQIIYTTSPDLYTFQSNTILDLTATLNSSFSNGSWDINVNFGISVDTEWDITIEPDISL